MSDYKEILNHLKNNLLNDFEDIESYQQLLYIIYNNYIMLNNEDKDFNNSLSSLLKEITDSYKRKKNNYQKKRLHYTYKDMIETDNSPINIVSYFVKKSIIRNYFNKG